MKLEVVDDTAALVEVAASIFRQSAEAAIAARGRMACALTGGSAAKAVYAHLGREPIEWARVLFFWGDERAVSPDDPESNYGLAQRLLLCGLSLPPSNVHRVRADDGDVIAAAVAYERELRESLGDPPVLDLVHLGMGPDGHICSLFPGHPLLAAKDRWAAGIEDSPKPPPRRVTLTLPTLSRSRALCFTVLGADKAAAAAEAIEDPDSRLPAALASRGHPAVSWILDREAAQRLVHRNR
jgi:6-phosphogluconolactonase